jgi:hypothetical protein
MSIEPSYLKRQREKNPHKIDMKLSLLKFLVTRFGLFASWVASFGVAWALAQLVKIGVTLPSEVEGALILAVNQIIWGASIWAVKTFEMPFKKELQEILGHVSVDGLIGPQTVRRAEVVKEFAEDPNKSL